MLKHLHGLGLSCLFLGFITLLVSCRNEKQLATAKANAVAYGLARCDCEKQRRKEPQGDTRECTEAMARATRYLNINVEFGKFNSAATAEIEKAGNDAYEKCLQSAAQK
ncbi:hypothetical protein [Turneriella parva]|uniref:Lipoprotein n=1 Tax=Turneriella parva (strain ATCC BAA-1111 / DSM 21527 / NCTC 11395 / H) TaxID=869212 RepID=I4B5N6_TURPD|nr:hypothetical protein [Turneriella parva]AFM12593.1 hypothetical protein Turpa_1946 [Turneriella parva DSM 21527]